MAQSFSMTKSSKGVPRSRPSLQQLNKSNSAEQAKSHDLVPGLLYYEFLPLVRRSKTTGLLEFQGFEDVMERASDWYRQICGYRVVSVETVQFKFRDRDSASSSSGEAAALPASTSEDDRSRSSAVKHYYGDGLRVWLFPSEAHINGGVELGFRDLDPQLVEQPPGHVRYETVPDLLERFNAEQATAARPPVPGKIVAVESRDVEQPQNMRRDVAQGDGFGYFQLFSLRIFFYRGLPTRERIQVRDVVPKPLDDYAFEDFTGVLRRASQWLQSESPLKLYNLQTLFVKAKLDVPPGTALSRKVRSLVRYLKVLRIVYSTFPESAGDFRSLRFPRCLSHRVFLPTMGRSDGRELPVAESIRALKAKMSLWSVALRGNILCAESLTVDYHPSSGRGLSKINASAPSKSEVAPDAAGADQQQSRTRVILYFRVYTDVPDKRDKAASPVSMVSQSRGFLRTGSSFTTTSGGSKQPKCRIM
ncbi:uncharacterized protein LOC144106793 [Amblyomma americanum]